MKMAQFAMLVAALVTATMANRWIKMSQRPLSAWLAP